MSNRDIFSKHLPNVKLATRFDAEGREVQVVGREDADATEKEKETFDILVNAGYYRARIEGLSKFDKVVGGMTWCIECCDYDVDVDLLFHENLTIGQKIALVEKIVAVLPQMKCPYAIEPHQIQGLEFLSIHPVIQWLVKTSVENRTERGQRLKRFAISEFHNNYQFRSDKEQLNKIRNASGNIKAIQEKFGASRQYQPNELTSKEDESTRVRCTLLEYGHKMGASKFNADNEKNPLEDLEKEERLLLNMSLIEESSAVPSGVKGLDGLKREALQKHYQDFKEEMETDTKELSEQSKIKELEEIKKYLNEKLQRNEQMIEELHNLWSTEEKEVELLKREAIEAKQSIKESLNHPKKPEDMSRVLELMGVFENLTKQETNFKEHCRKDLAQLQKEINDLELFNAQNPKDQEQAVAKKRARINELKMQIAKRNRGIVAIERRLDDIPPRNELAQYQRRFHDLYQEMRAKHLETKQYYTLYNTFNDRKRYMEKELSLLNSICEAYNEGMLTQHGREDFIKQFEAIAEGVKQTEYKVRHKYSEERRKRDNLREELLGYMELSRQYAAAVKQLTKECQKCESMKAILKKNKMYNKVES